jgi:hypothetical protein
MFSLQVRGQHNSHANDSLYIHAVEHAREFVRLLSALRENVAVSSKCHDIRCAAQNLMSYSDFTLLSVR